MSDNQYKVLKHTAALVLPALTTLYFALAQIWHFSHTEEVMGTIAAINAFIGAIVGVSTLKYNGDGEIHIDDSGPTTLASLALNEDPRDVLSTKNAVTLNVVRTPGQ